MRKINYFTYMDKSGGEGAARYIENLEKNKPLFYTDIAICARETMKENVKNAMKMFALM